MRGLIIKDLLYLKSKWKNLAVMFIGALLLSIALGNYLLAIIVLPLMLATSGISTFSMDEFYNTESYTLSTPISRKKIILSKYIFTFIMLFLSSYIGLIIFQLIKITINPNAYGLNSDMLKEMLMLEATSLIISNIFYPIIYKYGCEKSRLVLMSIVMLLIGILSIVSVYVNFVDIHAIDFERIIASIQMYGVYYVGITAVITTIISYILSNLFYRHKDY